MTDIQHFHLFHSLPSELRFKIWKYTFPPAQIVSIRFSRNHNQYTSNTPPPSLLHTNHESRSIYLETHTNLLLNPRYKSAIFVNFALDTIFFDTLDCSPLGDLAFDLARSPHRDKILRCAIDASLWEVLRLFKYCGLSEIRMLGRLRVVALVMKRNPRTRDASEGLGIGGYVTVEEGNTVEAEIIMANSFVETLRAEVEMGTVEKWVERGGKPNVQLWLW